MTCVVRTAMVHAAIAAAAHPIQDAARRPLPVGPPIGGPVWTLLVPAILLVAACGGTWLLYRRFAADESGEPDPAPDFNGLPSPSEGEEGP